MIQASRRSLTEGPPPLMRSMGGGPRPSSVKDDIMTEDQLQTEGSTEPIRTASDLRLDDLAKRLDALEKENKELRDVNKELYAYAANRGDASVNENGRQTEPSFDQVQAPVPQGPSAQDLDNMENMVLANWHLERDRQM